MGRRAKHHGGVDVHVPGLEVEHVLAPVEFPTAAEAGAVIDDLLVRAELDLGRDSQSGTHRVDLVGLVHVLLDRLCPGGKRQDRSRQTGKGGEAVANLAVHRVAAPLLLLGCASSAGTSSPYSGTGGAASSCGADACTGTAASTYHAEINRRLGHAWRSE